MTTGPAAGETAPLLILCMTPPRTSLRAQALGLAEALSRRLSGRRPIHIAERDVEMRRWATRLPAAIWRRAPVLSPLWPRIALRKAGSTLAPVAALDVLAIGSGRDGAPALASFARATGACAVQLLDPEMSMDAFDLIATPAHDGLTGDRIVQTLGSIGRVTPEIIREAHLPPAATDLPIPRLAVLVGGRSRDFLWREQDVEALAEACIEAEAQGWSLLVTPSPRTPAQAMERLAGRLHGRRAWIWGGAGDNPYPGLLAAADAVLATEDSVNMISEAASAGLPTHIFPLGGRSPRMAAFQAAIRTHGSARVYSGRIERWRAPPLAEADRLAALIETRILSSQCGPT